MKHKLPFVKSVIIAGLLALSSIINTSAQTPPIPTNSPGSFGGHGGIGVAMDWGAYYSNNLASVIQWVHGTYTMPDGSAGNFQDVMDATAANYASADTNDTQIADLNAAIAWALANGQPTTVTNANGGVTTLVSTNDGPLFVGSFNVEAAQTIGTAKVWPGGSLGLNLTGTNRIIYMWDEGMPQVTHVEFTDFTTNSRVSILDPAVNTNLYDHPTAVASTLAAGGVQNLAVGGVNIGPAARGMSYGAKVRAGFYNYDISEMIPQVGSNQMRLSNHSYGHSSGWQQDVTGVWTWYGYPYISTNVDTKYGNYSIYASNFDALAYSAPNYLGVWASGNDTGGGPTNQPISHLEYNNLGIFITNTLVHPLNGDAGGYSTISDLNVAKDTLCVGAVWPLTNGYGGSNSVILASFSSYGPTGDGRIKPDVVACGVNVITASDSGGGYEYESGTSFASPNVAGSINLLAQYYAQLHTNAAALLSSTLKALVINTADQCGTNIGPSYKYGWGLMDTASAALLIGNDASNGVKCFIKEVMLSNATYIQFPIVSSGTNPIKVSIAWTDPAGVGNAITSLQNPAIKLVNDLDLRVISPSGVTNFPYILNPDLTNRTASARSAGATLGDNTRDNVEQVYLAAPTNGTYLVSVTHKGTLQNGVAQWVSIVSTGNTPTVPQPFTLNTIKQTGTNQMAIGWAAVVGQRYQVQATTNLASTGWQAIGAQVSARLTNVVVLLPYTNTVASTFYRVTQVQ